MRDVVGAGGIRGGGGAGHQHEARHGVVVVAKLFGKHLHLVVRGDAGGGNCSIRWERSIEDADGGCHVARRRHV